MRQILLVFIGGGLGSSLRYLISKWLNNPEQGIPYGTFLANIAGSFLIGFILGWAARHAQLNSGTVLLLATGFCGGFTTFSTFSYENHLLLKTGDWYHFIFYSLGSFIIGFIAVFGGMALSRLI